VVGTAEVDDASRSNRHQRGSEGSRSMKRRMCVAAGATLVFAVPLVLALVGGASRDAGTTARPVAGVLKGEADAVGGA
jgi:hypothetical protein